MRIRLAAMRFFLTGPTYRPTWCCRFSLFCSFSKVNMKLLGSLSSPFYYKDILKVPKLRKVQCFIKSFKPVSSILLKLRGLKVVKCWIVLTAAPRAFYCTQMCEKSKSTTFSYYKTNSFQLTQVHYICCIFVRFD